MLTKNEIEDLLQQALKQGAELAELFFEDTHKSNLNILNQEVISCSKQHVFGVGICLLKKLKEIYIYSNKADYDSILRLIKEQKDVFQTDDPVSLNHLGESKLFKNNI